MMVDFLRHRHLKEILHNAQILTPFPALPSKSLEHNFSLLLTAADQSTLLLWPASELLIKPPNKEEGVERALLTPFIDKVAAPELLPFSQVTEPEINEIYDNDVASQVHFSWEARIGLLVWRSEAKKGHCVSAYTMTPEPFVSAQITYNQTQN